jgi:AAA+ ATPase superfamily predicted ATPase
MLYDLPVASRKTPNPFHYGDLALDEAFTDRERELDALVADIRNGQNVAIIAPRRFGKSSLVKRATQSLLAEGVLVVEVDLMSTPTKAKLAAKLAKSIHDDVATVLMKAKERLRIFANLRVVPVVTVNAQDGSTTFSFTASLGEEDIDDTLDDLLGLPAQLAADQGKRVVVYFDEFQEVINIDPGLPGRMRAIFQAQPEVAHIYSGSKRHMMQRLFNDENEPFYRSAKTMEIGEIPAPLFKEFVAKQFDRTDRGVSDDVLDRLLAVTHGHPYATQELAYALWEEVPEGFTATVADFDAALAAVLRAEHAHFTLLWDRASRAQRIVLQALATEPGRPLTDSYRQKHQLPSASGVQRALRALVDGELVAKRSDGNHDLSEPFLREWIRAFVL